MEIAINLPTYHAFIITEDATLLSRWKDWLKGFEAVIKAMKIEEEKDKRAMLIHYGGRDIRKLIKKLDNAGDNKQ